MVFIRENIEVEVIYFLLKFRRIKVRFKEKNRSVWKIYYLFIYLVNRIGLG